VSRKNDLKNHTFLAWYRVPSSVEKDGVGPLSKPVVRAFSVLAVSKGPLHPSHPNLVPVIKLGNKGLDIQKGGFIQHIHFAKVKNVSFPLFQAHNRHPNRIWPSRRSQGKHPMKRLFHVRPTLQVIPFGLIKDVEKDEVGEPLNILESCFVRLKNLCPALGVGIEDALNRDAAFALIGGIEHADGCKNVLSFLFHSTSQMRLFSPILT
jgi:hypothetical protein